MLQIPVARGSGGGGNWATRSKCIIVVTQVVLKIPFSRYCLFDSVILTRLVLFDSPKYRENEKPKISFPVTFLYAASYS